MTIVGRQYEQQQLQKRFQSAQAEFIGVYGRCGLKKTLYSEELIASSTNLFKAF